MITNVKRIGNSHGIILPSFIIKLFGLEVASQLKVEIKDHHIVITPLTKTTAKSLQELFKDYRGSYKSNVVFDDAKGDEVW